MLPPLGAGLEGSSLAKARACAGDHPLALRQPARCFQPTLGSAESGRCRLVGLCRICWSSVNRALHKGMNAALVCVCARYTNAVAKREIRRVDRPIPWPGSRRHGQVVVCIPLRHRQMITSPTATFRLAGVNWKSATLTLHVAAKPPEMLVSKTAATRSNFFIAHFFTQIFSTDNV